VPLAAEHAAAFLSQTGGPVSDYIDAFKADAHTLPAFATASQPDGSFAIYRISRVEQSQTPDMARVDGLKQELVRAQGELELDAYTEDLKKRFKATITKLPGPEDSGSSSQ